MDALCNQEVHADQHGPQGGRTSLGGAEMAGEWINLVSIKPLFLMLHLGGTSFLFICTLQSRFISEDSCFNTQFMYRYMVLLS